MAADESQVLGKGKKQKSKNEAPEEETKVEEQKAQIATIGESISLGKVNKLIGSRGPDS